MAGTSPTLKCIASPPSCPALSLHRHARHSGLSETYGLSTVMPGLVPGIHDFLCTRAWMPGTSPAMTMKRIASSFVMPALVAGIHVFTTLQQAEAGMRNEPGHDSGTHCFNLSCPALCRASTTYGFMSARLPQMDDALMVEILRRQLALSQFCIAGAPNFIFSF